MDWADAQLLMTELAPVIRDFVAASIKPLQDRLASLEGGPENILIDGEADEFALAEEFRRAMSEIEPLAIDQEIER
jgi:hypothetical protein